MLAEQPPYFVAVAVAAHHRPGRLRDGRQSRPDRRLGRRRESTRGHVLLHCRERGSRVETGLLGQPASVRRCPLHRLGLLSVPGERAHQQDGGALPQRLCRRRLERVGHRVAVAELETGLGQVVAQTRVELVERDGRGGEVRVSAELSERRSAPQTQSLLRGGGDLRRRSPGQAVRQTPGAAHVDLVLTELQGIAGLAGGQSVSCRTQVLAQPRDVVVKRPERVVGRALGPREVDEPLGGEHPPLSHRQRGEQGAP